MTPRLRIRRHFGTRLASEDGAALVLIALAVVVLLGLTAFVADYGLMWVSRREAQNAADAGALAGAVARAYDDDAVTPAAGGPADTAARQAAAANKVWSEDPGVDVPSWVCPSWVDPAGRCVQVDVFRDGTNGSNALPAYFGVLLGRTTQKVRASAIAQAVPATVTNCLRPWAVPDLWIERFDADPKNPLDTFDKYDPKGKGALYPGLVDEWIYPGYTNAMKGQQVVLAVVDPHATPASGWSFAISVGNDEGGRDYRDNIESCSGQPNWIGQYVPTLTGMKTGDLRQGIAALMASDPAAVWNTTTNQIDNSCVSATPSCGVVSPRVVIIAVFDPDDWALREIANDRTPCTGGGDCVKVVNMFGFFVEGLDGNDRVMGRLIEERGDYIPGTGWTVDPGAAFLWSVRLVR